MDRLKELIKYKGYQVQTFLNRRFTPQPTLAEGVLSSSRHPFSCLSFRICKSSYLCVYPCDEVNALTNEGCQQICNLISLVTITSAVFLLFNNPLCIVQYYQICKMKSAMLYIVNGHFSALIRYSKYNISCFQTYH